jgi:hypothetical protein
VTVSTCTRVYISDVEHPATCGKEPRSDILLKGSIDLTGGLETHELKLAGSSDHAALKKSLRHSISKQFRSASVFGMIAS